MKKLLLFLIVILAIVSSVQGLALTFQNAADFSEQVQCIEGTNCIWSHNTTGGNSVIANNGQGGYPILISQTGLPMTYAAATISTNNAPNVLFYDSTKTRQGSGMCYCDHTVIHDALPYRCEVIITAGRATVYANGVDVGSINGNYCPNTVMSTNPFYIGFGMSADDVVWGNTEAKYIFGMPENGYFLMKDILNPASSGFYRVNQTNPNGSPTLINSLNFTSTYGKPNNLSETVVFTGAGQTPLSYTTTGNSSAGTIYWDLLTFFNSNAPYGLYRTEINPQPNSPSFATSAWLPYIGSGANIQFDKTSYTVGETATITVTMSDSYYQATSNRNVTIQDVYGTNVFTDTGLSFTQLQTGEWQAVTTYTWDGEEVEEGAYYGLLYANIISNNNVVLMGYTVVSLSSTLVIDGFVKDAQTTNGISGAIINITQGIDTDSITSGVDGNYTSLADFSASSYTTLTAGATGYENYSTSFLPVGIGAIHLNLSLMPISPTYTGIALGGLVRTPPYNQTVDSATVLVANGSYSYTVTTNSAGFYIINDLPNNLVFDIWSHKTGFSNSTIYKLLVVGS